MFFQSKFAPETEKNFCEDLPENMSWLWDSSAVCGYSGPCLVVSHLINNYVYLQVVILATFLSQRSAYSVHYLEENPVNVATPSKQLTAILKSQPEHLNTVLPC